MPMPIRLTILLVSLTVAASSAAAHGSDLSHAHSHSHLIDVLSGREVIAAGCAIAAIWLVGVARNCSAAARRRSLRGQP